MTRMCCLGTVSCALLLTLPPGSVLICNFRDEVPERVLLETVLINLYELRGPVAVIVCFV